MIEESPSKNVRIICEKVINCVSRWLRNRSYMAPEGGGEEWLALVFGRKRRWEQIDEKFREIQWRDTDEKRGIRIFDFKL